MFGNMPILWVGAVWVAMAPPMATKPSSQEARRPGGGGVGDGVIRNMCAAFIDRPGLDCMSEAFRFQHSK